MKSDYRWNEPQHLEMRKYEKVLNNAFEKESLCREAANYNSVREQFGAAFEQQEEIAKRMDNILAYDERYVLYPKPPESTAAHIGGRVRRASATSSVGPTSADSCSCSSAYGPSSAPVKRVSSNGSLNRMAWESSAPRLGSETSAPRLSSAVSLGSDATALRVSAESSFMRMGGLESPKSAKHSPKSVGLTKVNLTEFLPTAPTSPPAHKIKRTSLNGLPSPSAALERQTELFPKAPPRRDSSLRDLAAKISGAVNLRINTQRGCTPSSPKAQAPGSPSAGTAMHAVRQRRASGMNLPPAPTESDIMERLSRWQDGNRLRS
eukprot:CAMPEP_0202896314 /NCGR_PEP_ID=MMETSP1392-20130828/5341_1 /ASSEMBLY_ACC=CAM_ASM_000868 /TAXON_ID=225041 /ORGANISM="Chlamydomonas chlamydogama, Strain SAG 11-48b" /LENGTH=320 /DNA_ID=CAMNT_0049581627 /DNA_START=128 /DNA_END=1090 /DNA_ORIENTATION=-